MALNPFRFIEVDDNTPINMLINAASRSDVVLDITKLKDNFKFLPEEIECQLRSREEKVDLRHISSVSGGIDAPHATTLNLPEVIYTGFIRAPNAEIINIPALKVISDLTAPKVICLKADALEECENIHADQAISFLTPQLQIAANLYASNAEIFYINSLKKIIGDIWANAALNVYAPELQIASYLYFTNATAVDLSSLTRVTYLESSEAITLKHNLSYEVSTRALHAPKANKQEPKRPHPSETIIIQRNPGQEPTP